MAPVARTPCSMLASSREAMATGSLPAAPAAPAARLTLGSTPAMADPVLTERRENVLLVTLNRPEARNAVNRAVAEGIAAAVDELDGDDALPPGVITGEFVDAKRAHALGVVNRLAEPGGAVEAALELAGTVARNGPLAVEASKRIVRGAAEWTEQEAWERQGEIAGPVFTSEDAREGATAFAEKRDPVWRGR